MNNDNLRKLSTREAREIGKKGGLRSGKVRAERKKLKECFETLLNTETEDEDGTLTGIERLALAMYKRAITGDVRAFTTIIENIGEVPPNFSKSENTQAKKDNPFGIGF